MGYGCYIHVPFCPGPAKCPYCAFYSVPYESGLAENYVEAVLGHAGRLEPPKIDTLYFGGGTPTVLDIRLLTRLIDGLKNLLPLNELIEFTVECAPDTVEPEIFSELAARGVNRVSIGVQAFEEGVLRSLGRRHDVPKALRAFDILRNFPVDISIDLIYGVPGQKHADWQNTLARTIALRPEHVSLYCLSYEPGTPFTRKLAEGKIFRTTEENDEEMYRTAVEILKSNGYEHYEISNFAANGRVSLHNMKYWTGEGYVGLGPSAHGYYPGPPVWSRFAAIDDIRGYIQAIERERDPIGEREELSLALRLEEFLMLGLRLIEGFSRDDLKRQIPEIDADRVIEMLEPLISAGFLEMRSGNIKLPDERLFISDSVILRALELTDLDIKTPPGF